MKLFKLTSDFAFKLLFSENPDLLLDLLNSFPEFSGEKRIENIKILNSEIPKNVIDDKLSILDIHAENTKGNKFNIEMQASEQLAYPKRALFYWSKLYSKGIRKGEDYDSLKKVYSFNFLNFVLLNEKLSFHSVFQIRERDFPEFCLTKDLEIHIIELPKLHEDPSELKTDLEMWIYLIREVHNLGGKTLRTLTNKKSTLKKAVKELKYISSTKENRALYDSRTKALSDYNTNIKGFYRKGLEEGIEKGREEGLAEGIEKGIESILDGIQLALELKFNSAGRGLMPKIRKIKNLEVLKKILRSVLTAKSLEDVKKVVS